MRPRSQTQASWKEHPGFFWPQAQEPSGQAQPCFSTQRPVRGHGEEAAPFYCLKTQVAHSFTSSRRAFTGCKPRMCARALLLETLGCRTDGARLAGGKAEGPQRQVARWRSHSWSGTEQDLYPGLSESGGPGFSLALLGCVFSALVAEMPLADHRARAGGGMGRREGVSGMQRERVDWKLERDRQVVCPLGHWFSRHGFSSRPRSLNGILCQSPV